MTTTAIAKYFKARSIGRGRHVALCPAHADHSPSLVITEGRGGRTLLRCWAGCSVTSILDAAGLRIQDLFAGPRLAPAQLRQMAASREAQQLEAKARGRADGEACSTVRKLEAVADALGARLARTTDDADGDALARLYHSTLNRLREAEIKLEGRQ